MQVLFSFLLIIGLCFVIFLYIKSVKEKKQLSDEHKQYVQISEEKLGSLKARCENLTEVIQKLRYEIKELEENNAGYKKRLDRLHRYENLETFETFDNDLRMLIEKVKEYRDKYSKLRTLEDLDNETSRLKGLVNEYNEKYARFQTMMSLDIEISRLKGLVNEYNEKFGKLQTLKALDDELVVLRQKEKEHRDKINEHILSANLRAKKILDIANKKAEELAGDAILVMRDYRKYERALKAIENTVKGYGNKYIIPGQTLLDELAEVYGHTQAGKELKRAREQVKQMIANNTAADCDYVEPSRRDTAILFVIDAFNGKVDSIVSKSKKDNYGTLRQQILDAYNLVNLNGSAFRNARITEEYRNARLDELKWACALHEVKERDREEQRQIREQMREEAKVQREIEKAKKEAEKEERMLQKALEIARKQLAGATAEQKAAYEAKLLELEDKLKIAEEKGQRALSMAQQTKSGNVYIISNIGSFGDDVYKIGMTRRLEPMDRVKELGDASVPFNFDVHAMIYSEDAPGLENMLHKNFAFNRVNKVNHRREFFRANIEEIKKQVDSMGLETHWTMAAEARQYYETKSIDESIANDEEAKEAWLRSQYRLAEDELQAILSGDDTDENDDDDE